MREYIVSLKKDVDYDSFWNQIESESADDGFVPSRRVDIVNNREGSLRSCHYNLTDEEASLLRNDPRVYCVEIPPEQRTDVKIGFAAIQEGNFNKTTSSSGSELNWGLVRHSFNNNIYGTSTTTNQDYEYDNDGTGVDIVIIDSGIQADHPEFLDANGVSRVQQINWYDVNTGRITGTQNPNFYRDFDGHGTHVAATAAGKTYGWAKNSRIYSMKVSGLEGAGDATGISITQCFDLVRLWHRYKEEDPITGYKRPTVVNMSFGYSIPYTGVIAGNYRGTNWFADAPRTDYGMTGFFNGSYYSGPYRLLSVDTDIEEMLDIGITVCIAAGNNYSKIDIPTGPDYYNTWSSTTFGNFLYYLQGMSPYSTNAIIVGALDKTPFDASKDKKAAYSNGGEGVHIFAAGTNIMSACSNTNEYNAQPYYLNSNYKQVNISGTSMASPQVAGLACLYLQNNPTATNVEVKKWLLENANSTIYKTSVDNDYTNIASQWGGDTPVAYIPSNTVEFYKGDSGKMTNLTMKRV